MIHLPESGINNNAITLSRLKEIISHLRERDSFPVKKCLFNWGWIKFNKLGHPARIGLNKKSMNNIMDEARDSLCRAKINDKTVFSKGARIKEFQGIRVVRSNYAEAK